MPKKTVNPVEIETIRDIFPQPGKAGIFQMMLENETLSGILGAIGIDSETAVSIDYDYIFNHAGDKLMSNLVYCLINSYINNDNENLVYINYRDLPTYNAFITEVGHEIVNNILSVTYSNKWQRLIDTTLLEYNILSPFTIELNENSAGNNKRGGTDSRTVKDTGTDALAHSGTVTTVDSGTIKDDGSNTKTTTPNTTETSSTYGFNSSSAVPADIKATTGTVKETDAPTNTRTLGTSEQETFNNTDTRTLNTQKADTTTYGGTNEYENSRDYTRKGNIGNRSFSELIEAERQQLRYLVLQTIYADLDAVLTRSRFGTHQKWYKINY